MDTKKSKKGFTLIELMVTVALLAILLTLGVPSFTSGLKSNRVTAETDKFLAALSFARIEAIKRNADVQICKSSDSATCGTSSSVNWHDGWIIWSDSDSDSSLDSDEIIQLADKTRGAFTITPSITEANSRSLLYRPDGTARTGTGQFGLSFWFCPSDDDQYYARTIQVGATGRPEYSKGATCS